MLTPLKLPILDLKRQYASLSGAIEEALQQVVESGTFILGPRVAELEMRLARLVGVDHAIGVASGSDALLLALMALDIGPGDQVLTTPYTFFATAGSVARLGARPLFVDVTDDFQIDLGAAAAALTDQVKAFLPVHLFGRALDLEPILPELERRAIPIVEDVAQALGAITRAGGAAGSSGELSALSFYPTKNLGAYGDGGMVLARSESMAARIVRLRNHGSADRYHHQEVGINSRLAEIQAAVLLCKLPHLEAWNARRRAVAAAYGAAIRRADVVLPAVPTDGSHVFHQYVIRFPARDGLREALTRSGIGTSVFYPVPLHLQPCFAYLGHGPGDFPVAERLARESLALPIFPEMTEAEVASVAAVINSF